MNISLHHIKKILCIKPRGIGDIVLSTIVLDNLIAYFPSVQVDYLTEDFAESAVKNNPLVNKVLTMGRNEFSLKTAFRIRKEKYDLILDLWSNPRSALITFFSGAMYRTGFAYRGRKYAYNILASDDRGSHHSAEHNLELLKILKIPIISKRIYYFTSDKEDNFGKSFIEENIPSDHSIIGIVPSGGWPSKRCDAVKWVEICKTISSVYKTKYLILWGPGDEKDANYIARNFPEETVLAPKTDLITMAGLINNCDLVIANDSGPMHISAALGIPTLGLFGPTNPKMHGPYSELSDYVNKEDLFCILCNHTVCPYKHECFKELPVDRVMIKINQLILKSHIKVAKHESN